MKAAPLSSRLPLALLCAALFSPGLAAHAQQAAAGAAARPLSYEQSALLLAERSDALLGASRNTEAARQQAQALKALAMPRIHFDMQGLYYQKTVTVSLGDLRERAQGAAGATLAQMADRGLPGIDPGAVGQVIDQVQAALPSMFRPIPDEISARARQSLWHPTLSTVVPLYTGGAITAAKAAARSGVDVAQAAGDSLHEAQRFALAKAYFGQVLAEQVLAVARDTLAGFDEHLGNARKMQAQGVLSQARVLQVQVARDSAERSVQRAQGEHAAAVQVLQHLLRSEQPVAPTNALFLQTRPLPAVDSFLAAAQDGHPALRQARAAREVAHQGTALAQAAKYPTVYAFGSVNLNRRNALLTEPDWIVGVGLRYTLWPQIDRNSREAAALAREEAAQAATREAWTQIQMAIHQSWQVTEAARREYLSLASSIASASESLRVQEVSFREGVGTMSELIDARNALAQARTERAAAAYKYDLALASLLLASGQGEQYQDYLLRADEHLSTP
ncbi:TolC family protein [Comamonas sp. NLF-1-9]|uniref:TolC family protein n=1 Tax=Comamonas sp. NLF-1-9 TaxID=2853163 RepID=UPI001C44046B|nr:TolC family protein [Comamonas sp. NLF-1-9]QXL85388.1 TolC family protein [Comamonas sp. NLF-1-9]